jgi:hypothetical protein
MLNWDATRIATIINAQATEGQTLEFKSELPDRSDRGRAEFLKDVSALANASGGAILFGVVEEKGAAESLAGLRLDDPDAEVRRLSQILESGIEPRIAGIKLAPISLGDSDVLVVDVPESLDAPHRYIFNNHSKFVQRMGTHTSELSYDQLRAAFTRTSARIEKLRSQWEEQLGLRKLWRPMISGPVCVVRLASLMSADERQVIDPKVAYDNWSKLIFPSWGGGSPAFNYEGMVAYPSRSDEAQTGLVQVNRHGSISAYRTARVLIDDRPLIPSIVVGEFIVEAAKKLIDFSLVAGMRGSAVLNVGLINLAGFEFATRGRYGLEASIRSTQSEISMPELWIDDLENPGVIDHLLRPGFDLLWQSFGLAECPEFNEEGLWSPK